VARNTDNKFSEITNKHHNDLTVLRGKLTTIEREVNGLRGVGERQNHELDQFRTYTENNKEQLHSLFINYKKEVEKQLFEYHNSKITMITFR